MTPEQVKMIVAQMFQSGELKLISAGNPNVGAKVYLEIDINDGDNYYFNDSIEQDIDIPKSR